MRSKLILFLAIIMGLITTVLFFNYMKQYDAETVASESKVEVVVATQEIKPNVTIDEDMLELKMVPEEGLHDNALTELDEAIGQFSIANIAQGEALLTNHLQSAEEEEQYVSRKVRDGYRAVSVELKLSQSVSNLIEPEDQVDVIGSVKIGEKVITNLIVEDVTVLAVGRRMVETKEGQEYVEYTTATVEVLPNDAVKVVNAEEAGEVHIALHSRLMTEKEAASDDN